MGSDHKLGEVKRKLARLERMCGALEMLIATCPGGGQITACTIIEALGRIEGKPVPRATRRRKTRMKQMVLRIEGMHCEWCAQVIEALVRREPVVQKVAVSYADREARVVLDPATISLHPGLAPKSSRAGPLTLNRGPGFRLFPGYRKETI